jgi:ABC-2 type transport system permease protein
LSKFFVLLRLQMLGVFGINKLIHSKGRGSNGKIALIMLAVAALGALALWISWFFARSLATQGPTDILPAATLMISSIFILVLTYFRAGGVLFGHKDYDLTMSLPVSAAAIVLSRITMLYLIMFALSAIFFIPATVAYGLYAPAPAAGGFIMLGLTMFLAPLIPIMLAVLLGTLIVAFTSRFRHANIVALVLAFALLFAYFYFVFGLQMNMAIDETAAMHEITGVMLGGIGDFYPPALWLADGVGNSNWAVFGLYAAISVISFAAYIFITAKFYVRINTRLAARRKRGNFIIGEQKSSTPFMAMYKRELRRLPTSVTYAMNVCMGPLLLIIAAVAIFITGPQSLESGIEFLGIPSEAAGEFMDAIAGFAFILPIFLSSLFPATAVNLSLEGRNNWLMCSLPLSSKTIFKSKIAMALTITLPATVLACISLVFTLRPDPVTTILLLATPPAYVVFNAVLGMYVNALFPKYDWESEYRLVKGTASASVMMMSLGSVLLSIALVILSVVLSQHIAIVSAGILLVSVTGSVIIYSRLAKEKLFAF